MLANSSPSSPQEVLNMLKESKADIFVDPVLHTACALDIKHHCAAIPPGRGRRKCSCFLVQPLSPEGLKLPFHTSMILSTRYFCCFSVGWKCCRSDGCCWMGVYQAVFSPPFCPRQQDQFCSPDVVSLQPVCCF